MKKTNFLLLAAILAVGYVLGVLFPMNLFNSVEKDKSGAPLDEAGIIGEARLEVAVKTEDGRPVANLEVDLAEEPGPPPAGGAVFSDADGLAVFNVRPGRYFIFFNDTNFPPNLENPAAQPVTVETGGFNREVIILKNK